MLIILFHPCSKKCLIIVQGRDILIVHRVIEVQEGQDTQETCYLTKGDNNGPFPSKNLARNLVDSLVSLPTFGLVSQGIMSEGQASSEFQVQSYLPSHPIEGSLQGNLLEVSVPAAVSETLQPALSFENKISGVESEVLNPTKISGSSEDDFYHASVDTFSRAHVDVVQYN